MNMYHDMFHVEQQASADRAFRIVLLPQSHYVSPVTSVMNQNRTLRASLIYLDSTTTSMIMVEQVRPHSQFSLMSAYALHIEDLQLKWISPTELSFIGETIFGKLSEFHINIHTLTYTQQPVIPITSKNISTTQPRDLD